MYCGSYFQDKDDNKDDDLYIAYNMHWNPHELALPSLPEQKVWYLTADTNTPEVFLTEENQKKSQRKNGHRAAAQYHNFNRKAGEEAE